MPAGRTPTAPAAGPAAAVAAAAAAAVTPAAHKPGPARSSSTGPAGRGTSATRSGAGGAAADGSRSSIAAYLKVYGLHQYARAFTEIGLGDLDSVARLSETEALEFLERLRVYPGHRLRLLRAIDCLRHAAIGAERRDAAQMLEDDAALDRLHERNEELSKGKFEADHENARLQAENTRLLAVVQQQDAQLERSLSRVKELEELVQAQTEQVQFLAQQLELVRQREPGRENELYRSYRDAFDDTKNDWAEAERIQLPEATTLPLEGAGDGLGKQRAFTPAEFAKAESEVAAAAAHALAAHPPTSAPPTARGVDDSVLRTRFPAASFEPPGRARMAQSLDSAQVRECLAGFDVEHIIRCLATALQNKIILAVAKPRPHAATPDRTEACSIFLEPACLERLRRAGQFAAARAPSVAGGASEGGTPLSSFCSPLMSRASASAVDLKDSLGKPPDPLNAVAMRAVPNKWDIYGFLRDVMINFRLEPEVSVITLFYLDRFSELSGIALTPDNWQRLTITAMMLASKVWNDESFENIEFAQLCPLYTLDEINAFERIFLKSVGYNMSVKGSQYAQTYFLLRTLGAKDAAEFGLEPMDNTRASRLAERCLEKQLEFKERFVEELGNAMNWTM